MKQLIFLIALISLTIRLAAEDDFCGIRNRSFSAGENITLVVFYNALGIYVNAGTANFNLTQERMGNKQVYHVVGTGNTNSSYDWIFKVRDRYETYIDTATLRPYKFIRNVEEGNYKKYENVTFNNLATVLRDVSIAARVFLPKACMEDGFPKSSVALC